MSDPAYRDQVLIQEMRTELKGSITAWFVLLLATIFLAVEFGAQAESVGFRLWLGVIACCLVAWLAGLHPAAAF